MTTSPEDLSTLNALAPRVSRFLAGLERANGNPTDARPTTSPRRWMLEAKRLGEAEEAVIKAELAAPLPAHVASLVQTNELGTIEQLRTALGQIQVPN